MDYQLSPNISPVLKSKLIATFMKTAAGRNKLAAGLALPLRQRRDYFSVGRKALYVEELPDGALPYFDVDPDVGAYYGAEDGDSVVNRLDMERVVYDLFEVYANPSVKYHEMKTRRFDVIDRMKVKGASMIQKKEDDMFFSILNAIAVANPAQVKPLGAVAVITGPNFADAFSMVESPDLSVARVFVNARDYADIRKLGRDYFDFETQKALLKAGILGDLWGAKVIRSRAVTAGEIWVCTEPEFLGRICERIPLTVLPNDDIGNRRIGFSAFEYIAMGVHNPLGVIKMTLTRT